MNRLIEENQMLISQNEDLALEISQLRQHSMEHLGNL